MKEIKVEEVMTRNPIIIEKEISIMDAAKIMKIERIGSLIVRLSKNEYGIITERDIIYKVVAQGLDPAITKVETVMTFPIITIGPDLNLEDAANIMWKHRIKRLPVVSDGKIIGILTENDIIRLSPGLIEVTREVFEQTQPLVSGVRGYCDKCRKYDENLIYKAGKYYCQECFHKLE